ncbi:hypothetical protein K474DRAFT_1710803 [Panus rudis PR-1116 ss-1]|nr:hypothetical protein K474DRAFT_1710803 [Panus rudis PR-1116 ss-1]
MAISEHGSAQYHIDWNDDRRINAQVIPLGGFKRGYVCFPQLGQKYTLRSGDAGGMASRDLVHRSEVGFAERWWASLSPGARKRHLNLIKRFD